MQYRAHLGGQAIDLGAGHGLQSMPLASKGFRVLAVDTSTQLLAELESRRHGADVKLLCEDMRRLKQFADQPELIICCGDTLSHLESRKEIETLICDIAECLVQKGKVILSFRDYSNVLMGSDGIIPVRSDDTRILTCILDYEEEFVNVTDLLYEKVEVWRQSVSTYRKVRITPDEIAGYLENAGLALIHRQVTNGMVTFVACKDLIH